MIAVAKNTGLTDLDATPLQNIAKSRKIGRVFLRGQEVNRVALRARWQGRWPKKAVECFRWTSRDRMTPESRENLVC
jgi:hypothetical protein